MKIKFLNEEKFEKFLEEQMCIYHPNFKGELKNITDLNNECILMIYCITRNGALTNELTCTINQILWFSLSLNKSRRKRSARKKQIYRNSKAIFDFLIKEGYAVRVWLDELLSN